MIKKFIGEDGHKYYKCMKCLMVWNFEPVHECCDNRCKLTKDNFLMFFADGRVLCSNCRRAKYGKGKKIK